MHSLARQPHQSQCARFSSDKIMCQEIQQGKGLKTVLMDGLLLKSNCCYSEKASAVQCIVIKNNK